MLVYLGCPGGNITATRFSLNRAESVEINENTKENIQVPLVRFLIFSCTGLNITDSPVVTTI